MDILNITAEDVIAFLKKEVPFDELEKNEGIYETKLLGDSLISIGVSYEDLENCETDDGEDTYEGYYYNVFVAEEYVAIGETTKENLFSPDIMNQISKEISTLYALNLTESGEYDEQWYYSSVVCNAIGCEIREMEKWGYSFQSKVMLINFNIPNELININKNDIMQEKRILHDSYIYLIKPYKVEDNICYTYAYKITHSQYIHTMDTPVEVIQLSRQEESKYILNRVVDLFDNGYKTKEQNASDLFLI